MYILIYSQLNYIVSQNIKIIIFNNYLIYKILKFQVSYFKIIYTRELISASKFLFFLFFYFLYDRNSNLNSHTLIFEDPGD